VPWLVSNELIPLYTLGYLVACHDPTDFFYSILRFFSPMTEYIFEFFDAIIRAYAMAGTLDYFQSLSPKHANAIIGQIIVGTISVTMGGILWKYTSGIPGAAFKYPGWDFSVVVAVTTLYVCVSRNGAGYQQLWAMFKPLMVERSPQALIIEYVEKVALPRVLDLAGLMGVPETLTLDDWKLVCTALLLVGFLVKPRGAQRSTIVRGRANSESGVASGTAPAS
jgi:hypothetical protein